jgi:hypothetical protein
MRLPASPGSQIYGGFVGKRKGCIAKSPQVDTLAAPSSLLHAAFDHFLLVNDRAETVTQAIETASSSYSH